MRNKNLRLEQLSEGKMLNDTGGNSPGGGQNIIIPNEERMIKHPLTLLKVTKKLTALRFPGSCATNQKRVMRSCGFFDT